MSRVPLRSGRGTKRGRDNGAPAGANVDTYRYKEQRIVLGDIARHVFKAAASIKHPEKLNVEAVVNLTGVTRRRVYDVYSIFVGLDILGRTTKTGCFDWRGLDGHEDFVSLIHAHGGDDLSVFSEAFEECDVNKQKMERAARALVQCMELDLLADCGAVIKRESLDNKISWKLMDSVKVLEACVARIEGKHRVFPCHRIGYDIVNVLDSMGVVMRNGRNVTYTRHGVANNNDDTLTNTSPPPQPFIQGHEEEEEDVVFDLEWCDNDNTRSLDAFVFTV